MKEILQFMSENPVLTFFLVIMSLTAITEIFRHVAYAIRGPNKADKEDTDDE